MLILAVAWPTWKGAQVPLSQLTWSGQVLGGRLQHCPLGAPRVTAVAGCGGRGEAEREEAEGVRADHHFLQDSYPRFLKSDMYKGLLAEAMILPETKRR